jgi:hypothetical protein
MSAKLTIRTFDVLFARGTLARFRLLPEGEEREPMNGSMLIPSLRYKDAPAAIAWLEQTFGFERHAIYDGPDGTVAHAELRFGNGPGDARIGEQRGSASASVCHSG